MPPNKCRFDKKMGIGTSSVALPKKVSHSVPADAHCYTNGRSSFLIFKDNKDSNASPTIVRGELRDCQHLTRHQPPLRRCCPCRASFYVQVSLCRHQSLRPPSFAAPQDPVQPPQPIQVPDADPKDECVATQHTRFPLLLLKQNQGRQNHACASQTSLEDGQISVVHVNYAKRQ